MSTLALTLAFMRYVALASLSLRASSTRGRGRRDRRSGLPKATRCGEEIELRRPNLEFSRRLSLPIRATSSLIRVFQEATPMRGSKVESGSSERHLWISISLEWHRQVRKMAKSGAEPECWNLMNRLKDCCSFAVSPYTHEAILPAPPLISLLA